MGRLHPPVRHTVHCRIVVGLVALLLLSNGGANAQETFEAATVKKSEAAGGAGVVPGIFAGGRWSARGATLPMLLRSAYDVPPNRIVGLPAWAYSERFDIVTTATPDATVPQLQAMAQRLLIDRVGLQTRWEHRTAEVYGLVRASASALAPGLRPAAATCPRGVFGAADTPAPTAANPCSESIRRVEGGALRYQLRDRALSDLLIISGARSEIGESIVDRTGLEGRFDIDLEFAARSSRDPGPLGVGVPLDVAFEDQLGLRFARSQELIDVLVIERVSMPSPD
jgi:bla regulator protein blaR1